MENAMACLDGSPYLLDLEEEALHDLTGGEEDLRGRLATVKGRLRTAEGAELGFVQSVREVFESNKIEGVGPDLRDTRDIMQAAEDRGLDSLDTRLLGDTIARDDDVKAVLGLRGARLLASRLREDMRSGRPMSQADIRALHSVICQGEDFAGSYKRYHVRLGGKDAHEPLLPIDVEPAMAEFADWQVSAQGSPILRAAAAHAWLTHIHPFEDGNGRIARLLANMVLSEAGLAPAIVKHGSERDRYLDCLRESDRGGNIAPLATLFLESVGRYTKEVERPSYLRRLFRREVARRGSKLFDWWSREFIEVIADVEAELALAGIDARTVGTVDSIAFDQLRRRDPSGNTWLKRFSDRSGQELLLWVGYASLSARSNLEKDEVYPSIFFSVRTERRGINPWRSVNSIELYGVTEFMIVPGVPSQTIIVQEGRVLLGSSREGVRGLSDVVAAAFANGRLPQKGSAAAQTFVDSSE
jgi:fido (protein-threonine AMPylation protein)